MAATTGDGSDVTTLAEAFRRTVLRLFVRRELMDIETAPEYCGSPLPQSGFHVRDGVWVAADDRAFAVRRARYCARNPVALNRLEYPSAIRPVTYYSDKATGPTVGQSECAEQLRRRPRAVIGD